MLRWARLLGTIGVVRAFDYPYMAEGKSDLIHCRS